MPPMPKGLGVWILRNPPENLRNLMGAPCILPPQCPGKFVMAKGDENRFEVSLGRLRSSSGSRRAVGFFEQVSRGARATKRKASYGQSSRSSVKAMSFHRRVIVKASIKTMASSGIAALRKHIDYICLLYTSPSPRDRTRSRMPSSA